MIQYPKLFLQDEAVTVVDTSWVMNHISFKVSDTRETNSATLITFRFQTSEHLYKKETPRTSNPKQKPKEYLFQETEEKNWKEAFAASTAWARLVFLL